MLRTYSLPLMGLFLLAGLLFPGFCLADETEILSLDMAVAEAVAANPDLAAIEARSRALAQSPAQMGTLPDPMLTTRLANLPLGNFSMTQEPMTQVQIGISRQLPFPGKLALRERAAEFESRSAGADVDEKRLQLIQNVKMTWWNLFYLDRALDTVNRNKELFSGFVEIAQAKYRVGKGLQQDVLLAQLELSKLIDSRLKLRNSRRNEGERLNVLLARPAGRNVILPTRVDPDLAEPLSLEKLQDRAQRSRPLLESLRQRVEAADARMDLAKKDYYPDFNVGALYGHRNGENPDGSERDDFGSLTFSMNLPVFSSSKQDRALSQRQHEKEQRRLALQNAANQVGADLAVARADYQRAVEETRLFKQGIIPQARQTVESMLAGYQVNTVDFLNLVRAQTSLYNYETQYWKAMSFANQALARMVALVGDENVYE